ncbi:hypothetical protein C8R45DRAFT_828456 [Mycena sanguinolenta]|nr:hypothetical protein C8R45DRAFT_828456 [Mycena sanguinolenta]
MEAVDGIPIDPALLAEDAAVRAATASALKPKKGSAHWTVPDEAKLLVVLIEHIAEAGDGANFTTTVWNASATEVNKSLTKVLQLKALYMVVRDIILNLGWAWDDARGACIGPASEGVWEAYVKKHPKAEPFCNSGWVHLDAFRKLMPDAVPRGGNVHRLTQPTTLPVLESQLSNKEEEDDNFDGQSVVWEMEKEFLEEPGKDKSDDEESDKENEVAPPKTPAPQSRKRVAAAEPAALTVKQPRISGGRTALESMVAQVGDFNTLFREAFTSKPTTNIPPTPVRLKTAIKRAQQLKKWLGSKLVIFLEVLENSKSAVDVYDSLEDDGDLRIQWVKQKVGITEE